MILDELQKNDVDIDMKTLSHYINYFLEQYKPMYQAVVARSHNLYDVFYMVDVINVGRAMSYLTLVYLTNGSEEVTRNAVQLVAQALKHMEIKKIKIKDSSFSKIISFIKRTFSL